MAKSTVEEIRERFDADVERFSNLETGQTAAMDSTLCLELVAQAASGATPGARRVLDVGCGAGNFTLRLRGLMPVSEVTLVDLSARMLERASERLTEAGMNCETVQGDVRAIEFPDETFDVILAGAVLHHLRTETEWKVTFERLFRSLRRGGSCWIFDMVSHEIEAVGELQRARYASYLREFGGEEYAAQVFGYIEKEDTPMPLTFQLDLLRQSGFTRIDVLHKNAAFAAFGGMRE